MPRSVSFECCQRLCEDDVELLVHKHASMYTHADRSICDVFRTSAVRISTPPNAPRRTWMSKNQKRKPCCQSQNDFLSENCHRNHSTRWSAPFTLANPQLPTHILE